MMHRIVEAREVALATKRYGRTLQVGSKGPVSSGKQKARELIAQGETGELRWTQAAPSRNSILGEWNWRVEPEDTEQTIDWNRKQAKRLPSPPEWEAGGKNHEDEIRKASN